MKLWPVQFNGLAWSMQIVATTLSDIGEHCEIAVSSR